MPMFIMGDSLATSLSQSREIMNEKISNIQKFKNLTLQINNSNNFYINYLIENELLATKKVNFHGVDIDVFTLENFEIIDVESVTIERRNIVLVSGRPIGCDVEISLGFLDLNLAINKNHKLKITFINKLDDQTTGYKFLPLFVENRTTLLQNSCFPYAYTNIDPNSPSNVHPETNETLKYITKESKEISDSLKRMRNLKISVPRMILISYLIVFGAFSLFGMQPWEFSAYGLFGLLIPSLPLAYFIMNYEYGNKVCETPFGKITLRDFFSQYNKEFYNALIKEDK